MTEVKSLEDSMDSAQNKSQANSDWKPFTAGVSAYLFWGFVPLFWKLFEGVSSEVVLIHRCLWSLPAVVILLYWRGERGREFRKLSSKQVLGLVASGLLIGSNWWIYIYGVQSHHVLEMSLGYFFAPLLSSLLGIMVLKERISMIQMAALLCVTSGVVLYANAVDRIPLMALSLAVTFSIYSIIRKVLQVPSMVGLAVECFVLLVMSLPFLVMGMHREVFGAFWVDKWWLCVLAGALTVFPLIWFAVAARGLSLVTLGMLNYLSPSGKFLLAIFVFGEALFPGQLAAFGVIWLGIFIYLVDLKYRER
jgi:chloramphenicol-sensitive protein RarD